MKIRARWVTAPTTHCGWMGGTWLTLEHGVEIFSLTAKKLQPEYGLLQGVLVVAPPLTALATLLPTFVAVAQDPATVLRDGS